MIVTAPSPLYAELGVQVVQIGNHGSFPPYARFHELALGPVYFNPFDPLVNEARLREAEGVGFVGGVYFALDSEAPLPDPIAFADECSTFTGKLDPRVVLLDLEHEHVDLAWKSRALRRWHYRRTKRPTIYSLPAFQNATVEPLETILEMGYDLSPQCYDGRMNPYNPVDVVNYLVEAQVPRERIHPTYDAKPAGPPWPALLTGTAGGILFESARLPAA